MGRMRAWRAHELLGTRLEGFVDRPGEISTTGNRINWREVGATQTRFTGKRREKKEKGASG